MLDRSDLMTDSRFTTNTDRVRARVVLAQELANTIEQRKRADLLEALQQAGVPAGALMRLDEVMETPAARDMLLESVIDGVSTRRIRGNAFRIRPNEGA